MKERFLPQVDTVRFYKESKIEKGGEYEVRKEGEESKEGFFFAKRKTLCWVAWLSKFLFFSVFSVYFSLNNNSNNNNEGVMLLQCNILCYKRQCVWSNS